MVAFKKVSNLILAGILGFTSISPVYAEDIPQDDGGETIDVGEGDAEYLYDIADDSTYEVVTTPEYQNSVETGQNKVVDSGNIEETTNSINDKLAKSYATETVELDFSSKRLLVATEIEFIRENDPVISEYNGVFLLQFETEEETEEAYDYYCKNSDFVEPDIIFTAQEGDDEVLIETNTNEPDDDATETVINIDEPSEEPVVLEEMDEDNNPISELNKEAETGIEEVGNISSYETMVIALIDSGVNADNLVGSVSMLGDDTYDYYGHGTRMYEYIKNYNQDAQILSIKALDENGVGTASSIYASIQYAIEAKADIINISISAVGTANNSVVAEAIKQATDEGIIVIGAAGNNGKNAKYYIPGGVKEAIIIGSATEDGEYAEFSNYGKTVNYLVVSDSTSEATARYTGMLSYSLMNNINISSVANYSNVLFTAPEYLSNLVEQEPEIIDDNFYAAGSKDENIHELFGQGLIISKALKLYDNPDTTNDKMYLYTGEVNSDYATSTYLGDYLLYYPRETPNIWSKTCHPDPNPGGSPAPGCIATSHDTIRFWVPKIGSYHGRTVGVEVQYVSETAANSERFSLDLTDPDMSRDNKRTIDDEQVYGQYGPFNVFARNSRNMHIYITFYETEDFTSRVPNGEKVTISTTAGKLLYGAVGLSNETLINGTIEWTSPGNPNAEIYSYSEDGSGPNDWYSDTYLGKKVYYNNDPSTTDGLTVNHLANYLYNAENQDDLDLYVGFIGQGYGELDPSYTSGVHGDPSIWFRMRFSYVPEGNFGMYVLDIDPNGGIYNDTTVENRAYQDPNYSSETDDWFIEDVDYRTTPIIVDTVAYDGEDEISLPTRDGYSFDGWKVIYGPGHMTIDNKFYRFGPANGKIQAQWSNYKIITEVVNGKITSDNAGTLETAGGKVDTIPKGEDRTIEYEPLPQHHLAKIEVWERDKTDYDPVEYGDEDNLIYYKWQPVQEITDWDTFGSSYDFTNIDNDYKIRVTYDPSALYVNYLEQETNVVLWEQGMQMTDGKGSEYSVTSPDITGYTLVEEGESQKIVQGIMPDDTYEVNVYYTKNPMIGSQVTVNKSANPNPGVVVNPDDTITYTLQVRNSGNNVSGQINIEDVIPDGTELVGTPSKGTVTEGKLVWTIDNLKRNENTETSYTVKVLDTGSKSPIYNEATWTYSNDENAGEVHESNLLIHPRSNTIMGPAALQVTKGTSCRNKSTTTYSGSQDFGYTGGVQSFTAPANGTYTLEVWGGSSGSLNGHKTYGGYSKGDITLTQGQTIYIVVGAQGSNSQGDAEAWRSYAYNGGGRAFSGDSGAGGATHIATTNRGQLYQYESYKSEVLIVAGGAGGGESDSSTGTGGGLTGGSNRGGTQTSPGTNGDTSNAKHKGRSASFGLGADGASCSSRYPADPCFGAGGGGWYGGGTGDYGNGGGGGSGYIGGVTNATTTNGVNNGNGKAKVSWNYDIVTYDTACGLKDVTYDREQTFVDTGSLQEFTAPIDATYTLTLAGGVGGTNPNSDKTKGATVTGKINLTAGQKIYIAVGGSYGWWGESGYNGGTATAQGNGSGGATAAYLNLRGEGLLTHYEGYKNDVLMVAGGGGSFGNATGQSTFTTGSVSRFGKGSAYHNTNNGSYGAGGGGWSGGTAGEWTDTGGTSTYNPTYISNFTFSGGSSTWGGAKITWQETVQEPTGAIIYNDRTGDTVVETELTYSLTVQNNGAEKAINTVVRDAIPAGTTFISGTIQTVDPVLGTTYDDVYFDSENNQIVGWYGDMDPSAIRHIEFTVKLNGNTGLIQNQADFGRDIAGDEASIKLEPLKHKSNIVEHFIPGSVSVIKHWQGDADDLDERPASITVHLINRDTGEQVATGQLTAANQWSYTWSGNNITPDTVNYAVYEDVPDMYDCPNNSVATAKAVITAESAGSVILTNEYIPVFDVLKNVYNTAGVDIDTEMVKHLDTLHYVVSVTNPANTIKQFDIEDVVPTNSVYVAGSATLNGVYDSATNKVSWTDVSIAPGATAQVAFDVTATNETTRVVTVTNKAHVWMKKASGTRNTKTDVDTNEVENYLYMQRPDAINYKTVTDSAGTDINTKYVEKDKNLYYHITVINQAPIEKTFTITDVIPTNTSYVSAGQSGTYNSTTNTVSWEKTLDVDEEITLDFVVRVTNDNCDISNVATVTVDNITVNTNTVTNQTAKIVINKTIDNYLAEYGKPSFLYQITGSDGTVANRMIELNGASGATGTTTFVVPMYTPNNTTFDVEELRNARYLFKSLTTTTSDTATLLQGIPSSATSYNIRYDVNEDGYIDASADVACIRDMIMGVLPVDLTHDIDGNGQINVSDTIALQDYYTNHASDSVMTGDSEVSFSNGHRSSNLSYTNEIYDWRKLSHADSVTNEVD